MKWTAEKEVEAVKQQLPTGAWRDGASLARCVEDLRMERDLLSTHCDSWKRDYDSLTKKLDTADADLATLRQQLTEATRAINGNATTAVTIAEERNHLLAKLAEAEAERDRLKEANLSWAKHDVKLQDMYVVLERAHDALRTAISTLEQKWLAESDSAIAASLPRTERQVLQSCAGDVATLLRETGS